MQCSANITQYKTAGSCCIYIETGKKEFDKWDLISYLDIKESKLYKYKEMGEKKVTAVIALNRLLGILRSENKKVEYVKDISKTSNFISNSYLGLKELQGKFSDVVVIRNNINKIKQFVSNLKTPLTLQELFGTDDLEAIL